MDKKVYQLTDKEVIGIFHGWKHAPTPKGKGKGYWNFQSWGKVLWNSEAFRYDCEWNWIMPVWYKFRELTVDTPQELKQLSWHCATIENGILHEGIGEACKLLAEGIRWYNSTQNKDKV